MKVWITKYALTSGILEEEVEVCENVSLKMVSVTGAKWPTYYHGNDWHRTEQAAVERAIEMLAKKRGSIKAQLKKLTKIEDDLIRRLTTLKANQ